MANRIQIRHGTTVPTTSNLIDYELGWNPNTKALYINNGGSIESVSKLANMCTGQATRLTNANIAHVTNGGVVHFKATNAMTSNKPGSDGNILHFYWDTSTGWDSQLFVPDQHNVGSIQWRGHTSGTVWGTGWHTVLDDSNCESYVLAKSGGTLTGNLGISTASNPSIFLTNTDIDIKAASISAAEYNSIYFNDKNGLFNAYIQASQQTNGNTQLVIAAHRRNTGDTDDVFNAITLSCAADGTRSISVSDASIWRAALGAVNKAGDTITGRLVSTYATGTEGAIAISIGSAKIAMFSAIRTDKGNLTVCFGIGSGGQNHGVYSIGYYNSSFVSDAKWIVYRDSTGKIILNGGAQQIITADSTHRKVYVTTTASVPSGASNGDIVLVKV